MKGAIVLLFMFVIAMPILLANPQPVIPTFNCVAEVDGNTYAVFGFENQNANTVNIPIGENNTFTTPPSNRGQPTTFSPGTFDSFFDVFFDITLPEWKIVGPDNVERKAVASVDKRCQSYCGDEVIDQGEECDDGNKENGDGCSANCQIEYTDVPEFSTLGFLISLIAGLIIWSRIRKG